MKNYSKLVFLGCGGSVAVYPAAQGLAKADRSTPMAVLPLSACRR